VELLPVEMEITTTITGAAILAILVIPTITMEMVKTAIPGTAIVAAATATQKITTAMTKTETPTPMTKTETPTPTAARTQKAPKGSSPIYLTIIFKKV